MALNANNLNLGLSGFKQGLNDIKQRMDQVQQQKSPLSKISSSLTKKPTLDTASQNASWKEGVPQTPRVTSTPPTATTEEREEDQGLFDKWPAQNNEAKREEPTESNPFDDFVNMLGGANPFAPTKAYADEQNTGVPLNGAITANNDQSPQQINQDVALTELTDDQKAKLPKNPLARPEYGYMLPATKEKAAESHLFGIQSPSLYATDSAQVANNNLINAVNGQDKAEQAKNAREVLREQLQGARDDIEKEVEERYANDKYAALEDYLARTNSGYTSGMDFLGNANEDEVMAMFADETMRPYYQDRIDEYAARGLGDLGHDRSAIDAYFADYKGRRLDDMYADPAQMYELIGSNFGALKDTANYLINNGYTYSTDDDFDPTKIDQAAIMAYNLSAEGKESEAIMEAVQEQMMVQELHDLLTQYQMENELVTPGKDYIASWGGMDNLLEASMLDPIEFGIDNDASEGYLPWSSYDKTANISHSTDYTPIAMDKWHVQYPGYSDTLGYMMGDLAYARDKQTLDDYLQAVAQAQQSAE